MTTLEKVFKNHIKEYEKEVKKAGKKNLSKLIILSFAGEGMYRHVKKVMNATDPDDVECMNLLQKARHTVNKRIQKIQKKRKGGGRNERRRSNSKANKN